MKKSYALITLSLFFIPLALAQSPTTDKNPRRTATPHSAAVAELRTLYTEFKALQGPKRREGPTLNYTAPAIATRYTQLQDLKLRFEEIDANAWPPTDNINYRLVHAEFNALEFQFNVPKPWNRDPGFYADLIPEAPTDDFDLNGLERAAKRAEAVVEVAKANLSDLTIIPADLATLALLSLQDTRAPWQKLAATATEYTENATRIVAAIDDYTTWFKGNKPNMTAHVGIGKGHYEWLLKNVYLLPYTTEELNSLLEEASPIELPEHITDQPFPPEEPQRRDRRPFRGGTKPFNISTAAIEGLAALREHLASGSSTTSDHTAILARADLTLHTQEWTHQEAYDYCVENGIEDNRALSQKLDTTLRNVGHAMLLHVGKLQLIELLNERAEQLGEDFTLEGFMKDLRTAGHIPIALTRWELTGYTDEIQELGSYTTP